MHEIAAVIAALASTDTNASAIGTSSALSLVCEAFERLEAAVSKTGGEREYAQPRSVDRSRDAGSGTV